MGSLSREAQGLFRTRTPRTWGVSLSFHGGLLSRLL